MRKVGAFVFPDFSQFFCFSSMSNVLTCKYILSLVVRVFVTSSSGLDSSCCQRNKMLHDSALRFIVLACNYAKVLFIGIGKWKLLGSSLQRGTCSLVDMTSFSLLPVFALSKPFDMPVQ